MPRDLRNNNLDQIIDSISLLFANEFILNLFPILLRFFLLVIRFCPGSELRKQEYERPILQELAETLNIFHSRDIFSQERDSGYLQNLHFRSVVSMYTNLVKSVQIRKRPKNGHSCGGKMWRFSKEQSTLTGFPFYRLEEFIFFRSTGPKLSSRFHWCAGERVRH